jgi:hypothetical protein
MTSMTNPKVLVFHPTSLACCHLRCHRWSWRPPYQTHQLSMSSGELVSSQYQVYQLSPYQRHNSWQPCQPQQAYPVMLVTVRYRSMNQSFARMKESPPGVPTAAGYCALRITTGSKLSKDPSFFCWRQIHHLSLATNRQQKIRQTRTTVFAIARDNAIASCRSSRALDLRHAC